MLFNNLSDKDKEIEKADGLKPESVLSLPLSSRGEPRRVRHSNNNKEDTKLETKKKRQKK